MASRAKRINWTPEEKNQRRIAARRRFRGLGKLIIANLSWMQDQEDDTLTDNVKKNIELLTRKRIKKSILSVEDKTMLNKPHWARTDEEKARLRKIVSNLKCFRRYPSEVKNELPSVLNFAFFGPNRVIIKQGYEALNVYVILTGEVTVSQTTYNSLLKTDVTKDVLIMGPGSIFGEVAFLHNVKRQATVTTSTASEFLYVNGEDFNRVLKDTIAKQWAETQDILTWFTYFEEWTDKDILETCILSKKKYYQPDQLILSKTGGHQDFAYFVTKGTCELMQALTIKTTYKRGIPHYTLIEEQEEKEDRMSHVAKSAQLKMLYPKAESTTEVTPTKRFSLRPVISTSRPSLRPSYIFPEIQTHFMTICTYKKLACFNLGEDMTNRMVVASTDAECLLIPRYFLLEKGQFTFSNLKQYLIRHIPSTRKIFQNFLVEKKWNLYKQRLVDNILSGKKCVNDNCIHNVPYTIRLKDDI